MNIFFNTSTEYHLKLEQYKGNKHKYQSSSCKQGMHALSDVGDFFLTPVRYFFNGRCVKVFQEKTILAGTATSDYKVNSYLSYCHRSDRVAWLEDASTGTSKKNFFKTIFMIIAIVPGIFLGTAVKGLSYLSSKTRDCHAEVKKHFTRIDKHTIGLKSNPFSLIQIKENFGNLKKRPLHEKVHTLIIYGNNVEIVDDPGIFDLDPYKIVLIGVQIENGPSRDCLVDKIASSPKWKSRYPKEVNSIEEALDDKLPRRSLFSSEKFHQLYVVKE